MKFLVDNQLPVALVRFLTSRGEEALHVLDVGLAQASDAKIWQYAAASRMILVSKDEDFFHLAGLPEAPVKLVWVRLGNCRNPQLLAAIDRALPRVRACLEAGDRVVEVR